MPNEDRIWVSSASDMNKFHSLELLHIIANLLQQLGAFTRDTNASGYATEMIYGLTV